MFKRNVKKKTIFPIAVWSQDDNSTTVAVETTTIAIVETTTSGTNETTTISGNESTINGGNITATIGIVETTTISGNASTTNTGNITTTCPTPGVQINGQRPPRPSRPWPRPTRRIRPTIWY